MLFEDTEAYSYFVMLVCVVAAGIAALFHCTARSLLSLAEKVNQHVFVGSSELVKDLTDLAQLPDAASAPSPAQPPPPQPSSWSAGSVGRRDSPSPPPCLSASTSAARPSSAEVNVEATDHMMPARSEEARSEAADGAADGAEAAAVAFEGAAAAVARATEPSAEGSGGRAEGSVSIGTGWDTVTARLSLIAQIATRVSVSLCGFLLGGIGWFLGTSVFGSMPMEWSSVVVIHVCNASGLCFVGRYIDVYLRRFPDTDGGGRAHPATGLSLSKMTRDSSQSGRAASRRSAHFHRAANAPHCTDTDHDAGDAGGGADDGARHVAKPTSLSRKASHALSRAASGVVSPMAPSEERRSLTAAVHGRVEGFELPVSPKTQTGG